jgi:arylsulfatase A-like enzyme
MFKRISFLVVAVFLVTLLNAQDKSKESKPNILIIWGDDVGMWDISAYHRGMMGGTTPNIDKIADQGIMFMDHYAQASCTAGRASFILGQYPMRTGLSSVGLPGAPEGIQKSDPTIAELLKPLGYATGQFGKNHLGDRDEYLPTNHGFDEFYGILYHLNAGEYIEQSEYPTNPEELKKHGLDKQRGIVHSWAGKSEVKKLGNFGKEEQRHLDQDVLKESKRFITDAVKEDKPFFVWHNTTRMHYKTNLSDKYDGATGHGLYADGMKELDDIVGELTELLEELGVAENTIIMFATDNGAATNSWPDGGNHPFHGEKGAGGWEGGFKVPCMVQWKGHIPAGQTTGEFMTMEDWMPTLLSWVGGGDVKSELLSGKKVGDMNYKVHLDGFDQSEMILRQGETKRSEFYYFTESKFHGVRYKDWKILFIDQKEWFRAEQTSLSSPYIINLKQDPFERMIYARGYDEWAENRSWVFGPAAAMVANFIKSFQDFPPSQASMNLEVGNLAKMIKPANH